MRKAILILVCLLLSASVVTSQRKRPKAQPKTPPKTDNSYLVPIPEDELLYTPEDYERLRHSGWRVATSSAVDKTDGVQTLFYYDRARIERPPTNIVRAWIKTEDIKSNDEAESSALVLEEYDCSNRRRRVIQETYYDKDGKSQTSSGKTPAPWSYAIPDSTGERLLLILCENRLDEEAVNASLAAKWFREGRQQEKAGEISRAAYWYEIALKHAPKGTSPGHWKITFALKRVSRPNVNSPSP